MTDEKDDLISRWHNYELSIPEAERLLSILVVDAKTLKEIAVAIHYPDCWDISAYPTLLSAIENIGCNPEDCTKNDNAGIINENSTSNECGSV